MGLKAVKRAIHRVVAVVVLVASFLVLAPDAAAQTLRIIPTAEVDPATVLASPTMIFDNNMGDPNRPRFRAYLEWNGGAFTDVSSLVAWSSSAGAVFESLGQGEFQIHGPGACIVSASLGDWSDQLPVRLRAAEGEEGLREANPPGTPVDSGVLKQQTLAFIDQLEARGVPVAALRDAVNRCAFHDDRSFRMPAGQPRRWLESGVLGQWHPAGLEVRLSLLPAWTWHSEPTIVLADRVADSVRDGEFFGPVGQFVNNIDTVVHELIHEIVHESELEFEPQPEIEGDEATDNAVREEEIWTERIANSGGLLDNIAQAAQILALPNPTHQNLYKLRTLLINAKGIMRGLRNRDAILFGLIMRWLNIEHNSDDGGGSNGDGTNSIPDFLDDWLRRNGSTTTRSRRRLSPSPRTRAAARTASSWCRGISSTRIPARITQSPPSLSDARVSTSSAATSRAA